MDIVQSFIKNNIAYGCFIQAEKEFLLVKNNKEAAERFNDKALSFVKECEDPDTINMIINDEQYTKIFDKNTLRKLQQDAFGSGYRNLGFVHYLTKYKFKNYDEYELVIDYIHTYSRTIEFSENTTKLGSISDNTSIVTKELTQDSFSLNPDSSNCKANNIYHTLIAKNGVLDSGVLDILQLPQEHFNSVFMLRTSDLIIDSWVSSVDTDSSSIGNLTSNKTITKLQLTKYEENILRGINFADIDHNLASFITYMFRKYSPSNRDIERSFKNIAIRDYIINSFSNELMNEINETSKKKGYSKLIKYLFDHVNESITFDMLGSQLQAHQQGLPFLVAISATLDKL